MFQLDIIYTTSYPRCSPQARQKQKDSAIFFAFTYIDIGKIIHELLVANGQVRSCTFALTNLVLELLFLVQLHLHPILTSTTSV